VRQTTFNALNQITESTGGGPLQFTGSLNKSGTVTVGGNPAPVDTNNNFSGVADVSAGTNIVAVVAANLNGNAVTNNYQVVVPPHTSVTPTYDLNGNMLTNGRGQTYSWDAKNELVAITYADGSTSAFKYDGLGRRVSVIETNSGATVTSTKQFVWIGSGMAEERDATNTVQKRFFAQGEQIGSQSYYYTFDHLGSVREMTDSSGTIVARYDYDPYGRVTLVSGTNLSDFQYAGYYAHATSGLNLTMYRAYDSNTARWLSRDPIGENGGINLYGYVGNDPIYWVDGLGLSAVINYSNGTSTTANSAQDFVTDVNNSAAGSIDSITAEGHGNSNNQNFHPEDNASSDGLTYDFKNVSVIDNNGTKLADLRTLLKGKFDPNGSKLLTLQGCDTAQGNDNIAKGANKVLPGINVMGSPGPTVGLPGIAPSIGFPIALFGDRIYANGVLQ